MDTERSHDFDIVIAVEAIERERQRRLDDLAKALAETLSNRQNA